MKKFYSEPEMEVRVYSLAQSVCTEPSNPGDLNPIDPDDNKNDLNKDDYYGGYFG